MMIFPRRTMIGLLICLVLSACSDAGPETATSPPSPSLEAASLFAERLECLPNELVVESHADGPASEGWATSQEALMGFLGNRYPDARFDPSLFVTENLTSRSATMLAVVGELTRGVFYLRKYPRVGWNVGDYQACNGFLIDGR